MSGVVPIDNKQLKHSFRAVEETASPDEEAVKDYELIKDLAGDPRWEALCRVIDERVNSLETLVEVEDGFEDVTATGFKFLAARLAMRHLMDIRVLPEMTKEAEELSEQDNSRDTT